MIADPIRKATLEALQHAERVALTVEFHNHRYLTDEVPTVFGNKWRDAFSRIREDLLERYDLEKLLLLADREYVCACQFEATFLNLLWSYSPESCSFEGLELPTTPEECEDNYSWGRAEILFCWLGRIPRPNDLLPDSGCCDSCGSKIEPEHRDVILAKALSWYFEAADLLPRNPSEAFDRLYEASHALALSEGLLMWGARTEADMEERTMNATKGAERVHSKPGGSREKKGRIRSIWASGKYSTVDAH